MALTSRAKWWWSLPIAMLLAGLVHYLIISPQFQARGGPSGTGALAVFAAGMSDPILIVGFVLGVRACMAVIPTKQRANPSQPADELATTQIPSRSEVPKTDSYRAAIEASPETEGNSANSLKNRSAPAQAARRLKWLRTAEYGLVLCWVLGLVDAISKANSLGGDGPHLISIVTLAVWAAAPAVLRPLTTPGVTLQQRYAVTALILGAGLTWLVWLSETQRYETPSGLGILATVGLVAGAGFLRLGWNKSTTD